MTLTEYSIFTTIAQTRSLTLTSETLHISKSAVHHALGKIEKELGMPLFERTKNGLNLTYYGEQLLPYANEVLRSHEHFNDRLQNLHGMKSGIIRIGSCSSICSNWIPDIIAEFKEKHPNIEVQVRGGSWNKYIIDCLLNNEIDIGIGSAEPSSSLDIEEIYTDEMLCITPPDIHIQATTPQTSYLLPSLIAKFRAQYPMVTISIKATDNQELMLTELRQNSIDFMIAINTHETYADCEIVAGRPEDLIIVTDPSDPLAGRDYVDLDEIFNEENVSNFYFPSKQDSYGANLESELSKRQIRPIVKLELNSSIAIINYIKAGGGKTLMPRFTAAAEIEAGSLTELKTEHLEFNLWSMVYYHRDRWLSPAMHAFIDFLKNELH